MQSISALSTTKGNTANEERERNPCPQRRIRTPRGAFFFLLFFLELLGPEEAEERALAANAFPPAIDGTTRRGAWAATYPSVTALPSGSGYVGRPGRIPGSGGFCDRRPTYFSCSTPSLALALAWSLEAWCVYSARAIATLCRSCFSHERRSAHWCCQLSRRNAWWWWW